jgi:hypothetical protein
MKKMEPSERHRAQLYALANSLGNLGHTEGDFHVWWTSNIAHTAE